MVYCGKPSKGCSTCRKRKIRCDEREPGCGQCEKRQLQCPGYRNLMDLMFRDQSHHVVNKARAKQRMKTGHSPESESSLDTDGRTTASVTPEPRGKGLSILTPDSQGPPSESTLTWVPDDNLLPSPDAGSWPTTPMIALMYNLAPTAQERGTAYFFSRFVTIDENACHQKFDFVYDVWKPVSVATERQLDGVMASMTAVGLVGVADLTHSKEVMDSARKSYGTALRLTNAALENPTEAVKDTTMLSVLILGLFEMMIDHSQKTMKTWHKHINGAAALAKMRGVSQFRTKAGIRMFMMLCQNVMISCIQREAPMPQVLVDLQGDLANIYARKQPGLEISTSVYNVLQARHDIKTSKVVDPDEIIRKLNEIDTEFERVIATFPDQWKFKTFRVTKPHKAVYKDICHVYPSMWAAAIWNGLRSCRMLINESILDVLLKRFSDVGTEPVQPSYIEEYHKARAKLEKLMAAIVASVPQHFGLVKPLGDYLETLTPISTTEVRELPTPTAQSPESSASPGSASEDSAPEEKTIDDSGPTLMNPMRAKDPEEEAERFMVLTSATNTIVWPLYSVGMASACTPSIKAYVVERLNAIFNETGLKQAKMIAGIVKNREVAPHRWIKLPLRPPSPKSTNGRSRSPSPKKEQEKADV